MCGIAGFFGRGDRALLDALAGAMVHRGPDGGGAFHEGPVGLTMRRLAIIDLAGGWQPIGSDDGRVQLVFNGELYNYRELKAARLADVAFKTASDTEVVLRMYEAYGEAAFREFNGMYAFALWDGRKGRLYLVRDRLGVKPLYYHAGPERLTFASELKSLLVDPDVPRRLDHDALAAYLTWQYVPGPATILQGIRKLPPASFMRLEAGQEPVVKTYWAPTEPVPPSHAEDFPDVLGAAVRRQMVADVPVGAFLSGGLDSSLVVALMREHAGPGLKTFTAGFADPRLDESPWAAKVAKHLGVAHEVIRLDERALDELPALAYALDEPVADRAALPTMLLARAAAREVKVVLTGEGSDELFGGYPRYRLERWARVFHGLPGRQLLRALAPALPGKVAKILLSPADPARRRQQWVANFTPEARARLLAAPVLDQEPPAPVDDTLAAQLLLDLRSWLVDDVLMKVDKTTMAASLEARVPFLDHDVVAWSLGLPDRDKLRGETTKYVVKRAAERILPPEVIHRPKQGFHTPTATWFRAPKGQELLKDVLLGSTRGLFAPKEVEALIRRHADGEDLDQGLWNLLILELWLRAYRLN
jgi:asparagine synthase (glutamine-hydrolysing)